MILLIRGIEVVDTDPFDTDLRAYLRISAQSEDPHIIVDLVHKSDAEWIIKDTRQVQSVLSGISGIRSLERLTSLLIQVLQENVEIKWPVAADLVSEA